VAFLLEHGVKFPPKATRPIHRVATRGDLLTVKTLIAHGFSFDVGDATNSKRTPLNLASYYG
jgi:hypothetical protein